jgi:hypothetical protein
MVLLDMLTAAGRRHSHFYWPLTLDRGHMRERR